MAWWNKQSAQPATEPPPPPVDDDEPETWMPGAGDDTDDDTDDDEPQDDPVARLEKEFAARAEALQQKFAAKGIDIAEDGEPVIRDPRRFGEWARPAVGAARTTAPTPAPAPAPEPPPAPTGADRVGTDKEMWEYTPQDLRALVREEAEKIAKPWVEQVQRQGGLLGKRFVDDATNRAADALQQYAPDYMHILEHPQFEEMFREQASKMQPEWMDNPQAIASTAMFLVPFLDSDQMPERRSQIGDAPARAAVNRAMVPGNVPQPGGGSSGGHERASRLQAEARWLAEKKIARVSPEELEALDATDEHGIHTMDAYEKSLRRIAKARGKVK